MSSKSPQEGGVPDAEPYQELPPGRFIRYLVLSPGKGTDPLACELKTASLDDELNFEAISYVWGSDEKSEEISCNGRTRRITANLAAALRRIRHASETRSLWADSICIDQGNHGEKSHQVALMGQIYLYARRVLIHIVGNDDGGGSEVESIVAWLDEMIRAELSDMKPAEGDRFRYPSADLKRRLKMDSRIQHLYTLIRQPWWERGWVVQEAALAREAVILWGPRAEISYRALLRSTLWLTLQCGDIMAPIPVALHGPLHYFKFPNEALAYDYNARDISFLEILDYARYLKLRDPSDRIYAFLSLHRMIPPSAEEICSVDLTLQPDYTRPAEAVYTHAARHFLSKGDLNVLHYVQHDRTTLTDERAPTWVPRWNMCLYSNNNVARFPRLLGRHHGCSCPAAGTYAGPTIDQDVLGVKGVLLDRIKHVEAPFGKLGQSTNLLPLLRSLSESNIASAHPADHLPLAFLTSLVRGLYHGNWASWVQATETVIDLFKGSQEICTNTQGSFGLVQDRILRVSWGQRIICTARGHLGTAPEAVQEGDWCCIAFGAATPLILREVLGESDLAHRRRFLLIGDAWIAGRRALPEPRGGMYMPMLGSEESKEWVEWDVEEQMIYIV